MIPVNPIRISLSRGKRKYKNTQKQQNSYLLDSGGVRKYATASARELTSFLWHHHDFQERKAVISPNSRKNTRDSQLGINFARRICRQGGSKGSRPVSAPWLCLGLQIPPPGPNRLECAGRHLSRGQAPQPTQQYLPGFTSALATIQICVPAASPIIPATSPAPHAAPPRRHGPSAPHALWEARPESAPGRSGSFARFSVARSLHLPPPPEPATSREPRSFPVPAVLNGTAAARRRPGSR